MTSAAARPLPTEHAPYYAKYIEKVEGDDPIAALESEIAATRALFARVDEEKSRFRYAPDKWSVREVVGHLIDAERVFGYRALRIARGDATPLSGFDENAYARVAGHDATPLANLVREFDALRRSHLLFFEHLAPEAWTRLGSANGDAVSVRALAFILAGHEKHHRTIVETRYL